MSHERDGVITAEVKQVPLSSLYLDPNNYRFIDHRDYTPVPDRNLTNADVQRRVGLLLTGGKNADEVKDLIDSFKQNGYLPVDQIQVRALEPDRYLVVEGNRRVATLKHLERRHQEGDRLGALSPQIFASVPVVLYPDGDERHHLVLMALKHIGGNRKWPPYNQARLLRTMRDEHKMQPRQICESIGISVQEFNRSLRALALVDRYLKSDYADQFRTERFNLFREIIVRPALRDWLGFDDDRHTIARPANLRRLFSWMSTELVVTEDEEDEEGEGREGKAEGGLRSREPIITSAGQIRELSEIINDEKALANLEQTRSITSASLRSDVLGKNRVRGILGTLERDSEELFRLLPHIDDRDQPHIQAVTSKLERLLPGRAPSILGTPLTAAPFNSLLSQHFNAVTVTQYRRLSGQTLADCRRINLIAGINNTGKTSFLEAIYLLTQQNQITALLDVTRRRGKLDPQPSARLLAQHLPGQFQITGIFDGRPAAVKAVCGRREDEGLEQNGYQKSVEIRSEYAGRQQTSLTHLYDKQDRSTHQGGQNVLCAATLSSPFSLNDPQVLARANEVSIERKSKDRIIEFLRNYVDRGIKYIELSNEDRQFSVTHELQGAAPYLSGFGEGMQRIFHIALLFSMVENGVLLIDELENAIHKTLLGEFTRFIYQLAADFNVQVFFTTHSEECIEAFLHHADQLDHLAAHALVIRGETLHVRREDGRRLATLVEDAGLDWRMVR